jgi:hypothetical protein
MTELKDFGGTTKEVAEEVKTADPSRTEIRSGRQE